MTKLRPARFAPAVFFALPLLGCPIVGPGTDPVDDDDDVDPFADNPVIVAIAAGEQHSLLLTEDGTVYASGNNTDGQQGLTEDVGFNETFTLVPGFDDVVDIEAGSLQSFLVREDGTTFASGWNGDGQLGIGVTTEDRQFGAAEIPGGGFEQIRSGGGHTFGVADGQIFGWGNNLSGEVGNGTTVDVPAPFGLLVLEEEDVVAFDAAAGGGHSAAVTDDGVVWTWGSNMQGQLGDAGDGPNALTPLILDIEDLTAVDIAVGGTHAIALADDGTVWGWGTNNVGQLGLGTTTEVERPTQIPGLSNIVAIDAGITWNVALDADGNVWTWGDGVSAAATPAQVPGLADIEGIVAGSYHVLAVDADGDVWGWGLSDMGQLGLGITETESAPVRIF